MNLSGLALEEDIGKETVVSNESKIGGIIIALIVVVIVVIIAGIIALIVRKPNKLGQCGKPSHIGEISVKSK